MARNKVQFQKGLSEAQFASLYGTEDRCREADLAEIPAADFKDPASLIEVPNHWPGTRALST
jgi:hypothetical protein